MTSNISLNNYSFEFTLRIYCWGTLLYIANHLFYKSRNDLKLCKLCKANQLESAFIEIINSKKNNIIVRCLYKYPVIDATEIILTLFSTNVPGNSSKFAFLVILILIY